jgi:hypothetical protein
MTADLESSSLEPPFSPTPTRSLAASGRSPKLPIALSVCQTSTGSRLIRSPRRRRAPAPGSFSNFVLVSGACSSPMRSWPRMRKEYEPVRKVIVGEAEHTLIAQKGTLGGVLCDPGGGGASCSRQAQTEASQ